MYFELQILNHNRLRFPKMYPISISARVDPGWVSKRSSLEVLPQQSVLVSISYQESGNRQTWNCHKEQHKVSVSYECSSACHVMDPKSYLFWLNGSARRTLTNTNLSKKSLEHSCDKDPPGEQKCLWHQSIHLILHQLGILDFFVLIVCFLSFHQVLILNVWSSYLI